MNDYSITINRVDFVDKGFVIEWFDPGWGWGELTVFKDEDDDIRIDAEHMGEEFILACLDAFKEYLVANYYFV